MSKSNKTTPTPPLVDEMRCKDCGNVGAESFWYDAQYHGKGEPGQERCRVCDSPRVEYTGREVPAAPDKPEGRSGESADDTPCVTCGTTEPGVRYGCGPRAMCGACWQCPSRAPAVPAARPGHESMLRLADKWSAKAADAAKWKDDLAEGMRVCWLVCADELRALAGPIPAAVPAAAGVPSHLLDLAARCDEFAAADEHDPDHLRWTLQQCAAEFRGLFSPAPAPAAVQDARGVPPGWRVNVQDLVALAALCLKFSRVERATRHEDGKRPETDSDHTVMLGVIACACAERVATSLDLGKIAQFATVHDLIEAYAGDVLSLGMSAEVRASKEARERAALERVRAEFRAVPWLAATIDAYETRTTPEARFVKILDKVMPKLTHLLNGGAALREHGFSFEKAHADHLSQRAMMAAEYPQGEALALFDLVIAECARAWGMDDPGSGTPPASTPGDADSKQGGRP